MAQVSAGLLMCRTVPELQFFLVHPGGPYFAKKNEGAWTIPKGLIEEGEDVLVAAVREFTEETGIMPTGPFLELGSSKMKSGKTIYAWSFLGEWDARTPIVCNTFPLEWPPRSKKIIHVPEVDRASWCTFNEALTLINPAQAIFLDRADAHYRAS